MTPRRPQKTVAKGKEDDGLSRAFPVTWLTPRSTARLGYNHGCECREITQEDVDKVKSKQAFSNYAAARL